MHLKVGLCIFQRWAEKPSPRQDAGTARTHAQPGGSDPFPEIAILNIWMAWYRIFRGFQAEFEIRSTFGHWSSSFLKLCCKRSWSKYNHTPHNFLHNSDNPCQHLGSKLGESNKQDFSTTNYLENILVVSVYTTMLFWQLWLVLVVKFMEMNSKLMEIWCQKAGIH